MASIADYEKKIDHLKIKNEEMRFKIRDLKGELASMELGSKIKNNLDKKVEKVLWLFWFKRLTKNYIKWMKNRKKLDWWKINYLIGVSNF